MGKDHFMRATRRGGEGRDAARRRTSKIPTRPVHYEHVASRRASPVKRRAFLLAGAGAGGALLLGWSLLPPRQRLRPSVPIPATDGRLVLNGWVAIAPDDTVTVFLPKAEMGQGVHTALSMILAEELDAALAQVRVEHAPVDAIYNNLVVGRDAIPLPPESDGLLRRVIDWYSDKAMREFGLMTTGGSTSVRDTWQPLREAGAIARATLVSAAAARWHVDAATCTVRDGVISDGERRVQFGELVASTSTLAPATRFTLKAPADYRLVGTSAPRLDARAKSDGSAAFGIDARPAGLRYAALALPPTIGGTLRGFDEAAARAIAGVEAVVPLTGRNGSPPGVAVVATSWAAARRGVDALAVQWHDGPHVALSSELIRESLRAQARERGGRVFRNTGDADGVLARATADGGRVFSAEYDVPYLAHAPMEPPNCTVLARTDGADVWVGTQAPAQARAAVAAALAFDPSQVTLHIPYLGGGFGRRLEVDFIGQAAEIAGAVRGTPVQVIWSREDDLRHDFYRPAAAARGEAALDAAGGVRAVRLVAASQEITTPYGRRAGAFLARFDVRKSAVEGLFDQPYDFGALRVEHRLAQHAVPVGYWRAVGHSQHGFMLESFVDELAYATGADPVAFRERLLARSPRALAVLRLAAARSGWGTPAAPAPDGAMVARGVAFHRSFGSSVAQVAEVSLSPSRALRVHRVTCALDCGLAINPDGIAQQMESAVAFALSAALHGEVHIERGRVVPGNFDRYRVLRIGEVPEVVTHVVPSAEPPAGIGEAGVPPLAPAVANALFALTGQRLRRLPLRVEAAT
jgi:isoquinoline 1-oxidoreductase beta subunit